MKAYLLKIFFFFIPLLLFGGEKTNLLDSEELKDLIDSAVIKLEERENSDGSLISYSPGHENPFTGWRKQVRENGKLRSLEQFKNGQSDGLYLYWWKNGRKCEQKSHRNGTAHGLWTTWYQNGGLELEQSVKNGKLHGPAKRWYRNGQKKDESFYQEGRIISIKVWKPDGTKCPHTSIVDGNGVWVRYNEEGRESWRSNYRNGEYVLD